MSLLDLRHSGRTRRRLASRHRGMGPWIYVGRTGGPPFENGWNDSAYFLPQVYFRIDDWGIVHLTIGNASRPSGTGETIFTLPPGYRPAYRTPLLARKPAAALEINRADVKTDGSVVAQSDIAYLALTTHFRKAT